MTVGESVGEMGERDRGGKSRAVYFWWGVAITVISMLAFVRLLPLIDWVVKPPDSNTCDPPAWYPILAYLVRGLPWLVAAWLAVGRIRRGPQIHLVAYVCGIIGVNVLIGAGALAYFVGPQVLANFTDRLEFDSEQWQLNEWEEGKPPIRQRMVHDLLDKNILIGMTRGDLLSTLGGSEAFPPGLGKEWNCAYYLGSALLLNTEWLAIEFGPDGRVVDADVVSYSS